MAGMSQSESARMARTAKAVYEAALAVARDHAREEFPVHTRVRWFIGFTSKVGGDPVYRHGVVTQVPASEMDGDFQCRENATSRLHRVAYDVLEFELTDYVAPTAAPSLGPKTVRLSLKVIK